MKTSVLVIAHNEEKYIAQCLESLCGQSKKADEIVLLLHNSTDKTKDVAEKYPIRIVPFHGPNGIPYARMEGLNHVSGDIVLCIDGDSFAMNNWIEEMTRTLQNGNILVGSRVKFEGTFLGDLINIGTKYLCALKGEKAARWIWGPSMAFWGKDRENVRTLLEKSIRLSKELGLTRNPDDLWLALYMSNEGNLEITMKTYAGQHTKETSSWQVIRRNAENIRNGRKILRWWHTSSTKQEERLLRFSDNDQVKILPFNPASLEGFEKMKAKLQSALGEKTIIELRGSVALKISGKGELDIYIPVPLKNFNASVSRVTEMFDEPRSFYPDDRARFVTSMDDTKIEIFVVHDKGKSWSTNLQFEEYLKTHPEALKAYEKLKQQSAGLSSRKYYRRKDEFINDILNKIN